MKVRSFKLKSGQDIVGIDTAEADSTNVVLTRVYQLTLMPTPHGLGMGIVPFMLFQEINPLQEMALTPSDYYYEQTLPNNVIEQYQAQITPIALPTSTQNFGSRKQ